MKKLEPWEVVQSLILIHIWPNYSVQGKYECGAPYLISDDLDIPGYSWEDVNCIACIRSALEARLPYGDKPLVIGNGVFRKQIEAILAKLEAKVNGVKG